jgi:transposase
MEKTHVVRLKAAEREALERMTRRGRHPVREVRRARVLLAVDDGCCDAEAADEAGVSVGTVERLRRRFCGEGLEATVSGHPQPPRPGRRKIDGAAEAHLVTLACSTPPDQREAWTMQLLADAMVRLEYVAGGVSDETVRRVLKKTSSSPG